MTDVFDAVLNVCIVRMGMAGTLCFCMVWPCERSGGVYRRI